MRIVFLVLVLLNICSTCAVAQENRTTNVPAIPPVTTFDPEHQKPLSYSDSSVEVSLELGKERNSLVILNRVTTNQTRVPLPSEMAEVKEIEKVVGRKLVIRGMVNGSGAEIAILDISLNKIIDKFVCYNPAIAPDGRFIAFVKFYPMHFADSPEDHYMLYDLQRTPKENRPSGVKEDDWIVVGKCVYPFECGNKPFDNLHHLRGSEHQSRSLFFWNQNDAEVLFADQVADSSEITIVLVKTPSNRSPTVRTLQQSVDEVCKRFSDNMHNCPVLVRDAQFSITPEPHVLLTWESVSRQTTINVQYKLLSFQ